MALGSGQQTAPNLEAIPTDLTKHALVVIPTITQRNHSKSNSTRM